MKVYVYKQFNDRYAYGEEYIQIFAKLEDAQKELRKDVEEFREEDWDNIEIDEYTESFEPDYVVFNDGDGNGIHFVIEDKEVIE